MVFRWYNIFLFLCLYYTAPAQTENNISSDTVLSFAKKQLGIRYTYASASPKGGFDCSGFVYYVFNHFDIKVPRASMDYEKLGRIVQPDSCLPGDIIVFTGTNAKIRKPGHVGIILSRLGEEILFIHSSSGKKTNGVVITNFTQSPFYKKRFIKIVRLSSIANNF